MGLQLRIHNASTITEIEAAFPTFVNERPDAVFISSGPFFTNAGVYAGRILKVKSPAICPSSCRLSSS